VTINEIKQLLEQEINERQRQARLAYVALREGSLPQSKENTDTVTRLLQEISALVPARKAMP
jgi:hypothetical protein